MGEQLTRRTLLAAAGATMAVAGRVQAASAAGHDATTLTSTEQANVKLVKEFLGTFAQPNFDIDRITARYLAADCSLRWSDADKAVVGPAAAAEAARKMGMSGMQVEIAFLKVLARGPLVATSRIDTVKASGKPDVPYNIAGVAIVKNGKIQEYCDYIIPA